jgi:hypothetical protein
VIAARGRGGEVNGKRRFGTAILLRWVHGHVNRDNVLLWRQRCAVPSGTRGRSRLTRTLLYRGNA